MLPYPKGSGPCECAALTAGEATEEGGDSVVSVVGNAAVLKTLPLGGDLQPVLCPVEVKSLGLLRTSPCGGPPAKDRSGTGAPSGAGWSCAIEILKGGSAAQTGPDAASRSM